MHTKDIPPELIITRGRQELRVLMDKEGKHVREFGKELEDKKMRTGLSLAVQIATKSLVEP